MTTFKGHISMQRRENKIQSDDHDAPLEYHMEITVGDSSSGRKFLTLRIDPATLIAALTGSARLPIEYEVDKETLLLAGQQREHKHFKIRDRGSKNMVVPDRITDDGWSYSHGYGNQHMAFTENGKRYYKCLFIRYVNPVVVDSEFEDEAEPDLPWEDKDPRKVVREILTPEKPVKKKGAR